MAVEESLSATLVAEEQGSDGVDDSVPLPPPHSSSESEADPQSMAVVDERDDPASPTHLQSPFPDTFVTERDCGQRDEPSSSGSPYLHHG